MLDISKIEAGRVDLDPTAFELPRLFDDIGRMFEVRADSSGLSFILDLDPGLAQYVKTDAGKLRQIIINLLGNSMKFTTEGGVSLRARTVPIAGDPDMTTLQLEVGDSGPGIEDEQLQRIFEPFVQVGGARDNVKGTGLGLAITKSFIDLLGGEISVESEINKGSLFRVNLPVALSEAPETRGFDVMKPTVLGLKPGQPSWRILVVEDTFEIRLLLSALLTQVGFEVKEAEDGEKAITLFEAWKPQFIWMDMRMPIMDGYEATRRIRMLPDGDTVKIVAITASAFREQRKSILEAGCDEVVHKPFQSNEIFKTMSDLLDIKFIYEEKPKELSAISVPALDAESVEKLPLKLKNQIAEAALLLDADSMQSLIERVHSIDASAAQGLQKLSEAFRFDRILQLMNGTEKSDD